MNSNINSVKEIFLISKDGLAVRYEGQAVEAYRQMIIRHCPAEARKRFNDAFPGIPMRERTKDFNRTLAFFLLLGVAGLIFILLTVLFSYAK
jgi:hypothetical protein